MKLRGCLEIAMRSAVLGWLGFILFSITFVVGYFVVSYQHYLKTYQTTQIQEIEAAHRKTEDTLKQLKNLLELAEPLISAIFSKTSLKPLNFDQETRLRGILNTISLLKPPSDLPSLQKVTFYKLSSPEVMVTRFGIAPFNFANSAIEELMSQHWNSKLILKEKTIVGKISVGGLKNALDGVLEVQVNLAEFISFLGTYQTIHFDRLSASDFLIDNNHFPFLILKDNPVSFGSYILAQPSCHWILMVYFGSCLLLLGIGLYVFNGYAQKNYRQTIENLKASLLAVKVAEESLKATLSKQQRDLEVYTISHQAQKSFHSALAERHKSQAKHIVGFLETAKTLPNSIRDDDKCNDIRIEVCLKEAYALSNGLWNPIRRDTVDLKSALKNLYLLFAEKLHQSNINLEMECLTRIPPFKGDSLLMDLLLSNVVGKAVYRVPDNGTVSITLKETAGFIHLQIQDSGYEGIVLAEKKIQESFSFFIEESLLKQLCKAQGIYKKYSKSQGHNITNLVVPLFTASEEGSNSNVVQLFS